MRMILNPDKYHVKEVRDALKANDWYCPCKIEHTPETRCCCKEFRDQMALGKECECHCGLYMYVEEVK